MRLDPERFQRTLCVSRWSESSASKPSSKAALQALREAGVGFLPLSRSSPRQLLAWGPLLAYLRRERVDVLHAHQFGSNAWAALLGPLAGTPVVIAHEHTWSFEGQPLRKLLDRHLIARRVDAFLTVSEEDRRRMIEIEKIDPAKLIMVPNGIPAPPSPRRTDIRAELGIAEQAPVVGTVCTLRPQKALHVLIEAVAMLVRRFPDLRLVIAGTGAERQRLLGLVEALGLERTVMMLGYRPDVPDVLRAFDVAASSSDFEGTPLSMLEYMEAGLPIVATDVGGVPDVIEDGVHGTLVERRDPAALAAAIEALLADRSRAAEMGRRGQQRRREEFSIEATVRRVEALYERLVADQAGGASR